MSVVLYIVHIYFLYCFLLTFKDLVIVIDKAGGKGFKYTRFILENVVNKLSRSDDHAVWGFELVRRDAALVRSPLGGIFDQCMGSFPTQQSETFHKLLICSDNPSTESQQRLILSYRHS